MLSSIILRSTAAFGGAPFRLKKCTALSSDASLKISALRSATALQKYKEIQNSNDPDFAAQVLAHFGIKPKVDERTSIFIGGDDKTLSINPQVNTNFQNGGEPEIKAIGIGDLSAG